MTAPTIAFGQRTLGEIAATLPGATAIFRRHKLDFCCGGAATLADAAAERGLAADLVAAELTQLEAGDAIGLPREPAPLIAHILQRYHDTHRREVPELVRLARKVEAVHRDHPEAPHGLAAALGELLVELDAHMVKEERILFPLMQEGGHPMIGHPIARMQHEHVEHGDRLRGLETLTHDGVLPADACPTWAALYAGVAKLIEDIESHVHLENNVLFPQFVGAADSACGCPAG
jgi:regulator of cell morphogenesis and NO signaling